MAGYDVTVLQHSGLFYGELPKAVRLAELKSVSGILKKKIRISNNFLRGLCNHK